MSGKSNGLAIFALLFGLGGAALGIYSVFFMPNIIIQQTSENSVISNMWYDERATSWQVGYTFSDIPDIELIITVKTSEKVFFLFSAEFQIITSGWAQGEIQLEIDNSEIGDSHKSFSGDSSGNQFASLTLQYVDDSLTAGNHTIHIQAKIAYLLTGYIRNMHLLVYTFK